MTSEAPAPSTSRFTSGRERRLWIWTAAAVAGVYSTLAFASALADVFYNQGAAAVAFLSAMFLIGVAVLTQGLRVRPGGREIGVGIGIAVIYGMLFMRLGMPERSHLIEYGVVAVCFFEVLYERAKAARVPVPWLLAIGATTLVGAIDEGVQIFLPHRVFDPVDIFFNFMAAVMAVTAMALLRWTQRRWTRRAARASDRPL